GSCVGVPSSLRTCKWITEAPAEAQRSASAASSSAVIGRYGVCSRVISAPQIAAVRMAGDPNMNASYRGATVAPPAGEVAPRWRSRRRPALERRLSPDHARGSPRREWLLFPPENGMKGALAGHGSFSTFPQGGTHEPDS